MSDVLTRELDVDTYGISPDPIVREAHRRFERCLKWESVARERARNDIRFANGDSENHYQWDDNLYQDRVINDRPALTISKVRQHNLQIINDAKQKKSGIKYRPIGDGATADAAEVYEGIARHIQDISNAQMQRGIAIEFQVQCGMGFTRVQTQFEHDRTFDQEIYIKGVPDPFSCYLDPDSKELDGSDARYGFVFADRPREQVLKEYPQLDGKLVSTNAVDGESGADWVRENTVRECEYYTIEDIEDELIGNPSSGQVILRSEINASLLRDWEDEAEAAGIALRRRDVVRNKLKCYKIIGSYKVSDPKDESPPGRSIPIIPWVGEVTIIDGIIDRKGHTRALRDAQRMLNYNRSASVEYGALQAKMPWLADVASIEGHEETWKNANTENYSVLPYKSVGDNGKELAAPTRIEPPVSPPAFIEGAQAAERDMMIASGQYEAELGAPSNEVSGRAINERQRQGDRATYHFIDAQAIAIRREGQILLELIPEVYDTARMKRILGDDGIEDAVMIDPSIKGATQDVGNGRLFNPRVGQYAVVSDVGPDYATQRQEVFNALVQIIKGSPELMMLIGDLLFQASDLPLSDKIAERLKPGLPPEAQQQIDGLQKQLTTVQTTASKYHQMLQETMQSLSEERLKTKDKDQSTVIDAFDADTRRIAAIKDQLSAMDPDTLRQFIREELHQAMQDNLGPAVMSAQPSLEAAAIGQEPQGGGGAMPIRTPDVGRQMATPGGV